MSSAITHLPAITPSESSLEIAADSSIDSSAATDASQVRLKKR